MDSSGGVLNLRSPIKGARLQDGDSLVLQVGSVQVQAAGSAFAAILGDGTCDVQDQLLGVQHIQASCKAFAAILGDGSVVTWGDPAFGGDSSAVKEQLKNVQQIQATRSFWGGAFAAILGDGSVVTWGDARHGGDSSAVQEQLKNCGRSKPLRLLSLPLLVMDLS